MNDSHAEMIRIIAAMVVSALMVALLKLNVWYRRQRRREPDLGKENDYGGW